VVKNASIDVASIPITLSQRPPSKTTLGQKHVERIAKTGMNGQKPIHTDPKVSAIAESALSWQRRFTSIAGSAIATVPKSNQRMFAIFFIIFQSSRRYE
jgi:hypothetical protein